MFNKTIATASAALSALVLSTTSAAAQSYDWWWWWGGGWHYGGGGGGTSSSVPEIDASTGALALAAVAAGLLLAREMRRRKSR